GIMHWLKYHDEYCPDREARRAPRATLARVARDRRCERVRHLVRHEARRRVRRRQDRPGPADDTELRPPDAGAADRADRGRALLLLSLAPLRDRSQGRLLVGAYHAGGVPSRRDRRRERHRGYDRGDRKSVV